MKLLLDDKTTRGHNLNANEACIFAAILKCTRAGRGWYGNYRELAAAMPFVISHVSVYRAVLKLLNLGLIERREEKLFALTQIVTDDAQNVTELAQNVTSDAQNVLLPNNPPTTTRKSNEKEKEQPRALCTHDGDEQQGSMFEMYWKFFSKAMPAEYHNRKGKTKIAFEKRSEVAQRAMVEAAQEGAPGHPGDNPNPYYFVVDFPEPQPQFLSGQEQDRLSERGIPLVQVKYNGKLLICTRETMELFNLEWVCDWLPKRD